MRQNPRILSFCCIFLFTIFVANIVLCEAGAAPSGIVAYVRAGDVWIKTLADDKATRITTDGLSSAPRLSASGRWVAYMTRQGRIWMARVDGTSSRVVHDGGKVRYLRWSPKPDMLAYVAGGELWAMTPQADHPLLLASKPPGEGCGVEEMLWSPDGEWIAYQYQERREIRGEQDWPWENTILKVNATGGDPVEVIRFPIPQYSKEDDGHRPGNSMLARWAGPRVLFWQCEVM